MESAVRWLKASYITGAVADCVIAVLMLLPARMGEREFRLPMGLAASLMFGWSVLLLWAYKSPMERKGVLLITIFPVISGLVATGVWSVTAGHVPLQEAVTPLIVGTVISILMGYSYWKATIVRHRGDT